MTVKHKEILVVEDCIDTNPVTILVEYIKLAPLYKTIQVTAFPGEYPTIWKLEEAIEKYTVALDKIEEGVALTPEEEAEAGKDFAFIPLYVDGARRLVDALVGAVVAAEKDEE